MQDKSLLYRLLWLFKANIIISCLAVGGGYMIIPLVRKQFIEQAKAFDEDELWEMYAIAQSAPGAIAINLSAITGFKMAGISGAVISCIAAVLPPLLIIAAVAACYQQLIHNHTINAALKGMIAAIAAIIIDVVYDMGKNVVKSKDWVNVVIMIISFCLSYFLNVNIIYIILLVAVFGMVRTIVKGGREK